MLTGFDGYPVRTMTTTWDWLGDALAVDLTATVRDVRGQTVDLLTRPADLDAWLTAEGERLGDRVRPAPPDLVAWRALREAIRAAFGAALDGAPLPDQAVAHINAVAARGPVVAQLRDGRREEVAVEGSDALARVAASAVEVLGTELRERLAFCAAPSCGMYYLAPRAGQRWCSPACGTRARVARHARRHRGVT